MEAKNVHKSAVAVYFRMHSKCNECTPVLIARYSEYLDQHPFITTLHQTPFFFLQDAISSFGRNNWFANLESHVNYSLYCAIVVYT